jgi:hypothetical protein
LLLLALCLAAAHPSPKAANQTSRTHASSGWPYLVGGQLNSNRQHGGSGSSSSNRLNKQGSFRRLVQDASDLSAAAPPAVTRKLLLVSQASWASPTANNVTDLPLQNRTAVNTAAASNSGYYAPVVARAQLADIVYVFYNKANKYGDVWTVKPSDSPLKSNAISRCGILQGGDLALQPDYYNDDQALLNYGWSGSSCCCLLSWNTDLLSRLGNCTGVAVLARRPPEGSLQEWLQLLPRNITGLDLQWNGLQGPLPEAFVAGTGLEVLLLGNNNFSGPLPASWGNTLLHLRTVDISVDFNGDGPNLSGVLPESWRSLSKLQYFRCGDVACNGLTGSIPETWKQLDRLEYLILSKGTRLSGELPWGWVYQKPYKWNWTDINSSPRVLVLGERSSVKLPLDEVCNTRGDNRLEGFAKLYVIGQRWYDLLHDPSIPITRSLVQFIISNRGNTWKDYSLTESSPCVRPNRYIYIPIVYGLFGLFLLGVLVYVVCPREWFQCLNKCLPSQAAAVGNGNTRIAQLSFVLLLALKAALVLFDVGSDVFAVIQLYEAPLYFWMYIGVLFAPNVVAGLVLHFRLCYLTKHQKLEEGPPSCTFSMYQWLFTKGGGALLYASTIFLWPYWSLAQVPLLFAAIITHATKGAIWCSGRHSCAMRARWFQSVKHCALLSLLVACIEAPFSAIVFTVHYARGMTAEFPTKLTTQVFLITVVSALLHINLEVLTLAVSYKKGKLRSTLKSLFTDMVVVGEEAAAAAGCEKEGQGCSGNDVVMLFDGGNGSKTPAIQLCTK